MVPHILLWGRPGQFPNYEAALIRCGGLPRFLPPDRGEDRWDDTWDGLLLPGGGDLHPRHFGQPLLDCRGLEEDRDRQELELVTRFLLRERPILGICRGMQVLNVALGGSLLQHVPLHSGPKGADGLHPVRTRRDSFLGRLYGQRFTVNTAHHQAVDRPGAGVRIVQRAEDGTAEALEHRRLPVWAVQWHPERLREGDRRRDTVDGDRLLRWFLLRCAEL